MATPGTRQPLVTGGSVTLNAAGTGQVKLGPDQGPPNWEITSIIVQTSRPAQAPIPRVQLYLNEVAPENSIGLSYDGSFGQASGSQILTRQQYIIAVWTGGQVGDRATMTINGERWS